MLSYQTPVPVHLGEKRSTSSSMNEKWLVYNQDQAWFKLGSLWALGVLLLGSRGEKLQEWQVAWTLCPSSRPSEISTGGRLLLQCGLQIRVGGVMDIFSCIHLRCKNAVGDNLGIAMNKYWFRIVKVVKLEFHLLILEAQLLILFLEKVFYWTGG